ncbi:MAG: 2Fe-2S iron-sulfur cluster binding domain-containing protein [Leptospirales bacterium]
MFSFLSKKTEYTMQVSPFDRRVTVRSDQSLLEAGLENGLNMPHSCRVGSCTTCKCRLVEGKVKELTDFSYVLDLDELQQGYILACQTLPRSDVTIEYPTIGGQPETELKHSVPIADYAGTVTSSRKLTHDIVEVVITLKEPLVYTAGQYADIGPAGGDVTRSYSFASLGEPAGSTELVFHIRYIPGGELSGWFYEQDRTGEQMNVRGPFGSFRLTQPERPIFCIAGGSGMAPIKAILEDARSRGAASEVRYLFGARTRRDIYCVQEMREMEAAWQAPFSFVPVLSEEPETDDWPGPRGLVTESIAEYADLPGMAGACYYLCGPPRMIDAALAVLAGIGVPAERIFYDKFLDSSHKA